MITLSRANLLVLDEPTNHLDVESIEALEDAIEEYEGTVIVVSHDRAFLRELATAVWAIRDGLLEDFRGTFVEWEDEVARRARAASAAAAEGARTRTPRAAVRRADSTALAGVADRRAARRAVEAAEQAVAAAEVAVQGIEAKLADPALYDGTGEGARRAGELTRELQAARGAHDAALAAWAEAVERIEP
jgi:ATP-binding cassette subfamily F protein 3